MSESKKMLSFKIADYQSTLSGLDTIENVDKDLVSLLLDSNLINDQQEATILSNYMKKIVKNRVKVLYKQVDYNFGRNFPQKLMSLGWQRASVRHTLMKQAGYMDIDMVNCHATIMQQLCKSNSIATPELDKYINNRENLLAEVMEDYTVSRDQAKNLYIILLFYGTFTTWKTEHSLDETFEANDYITALSNEIKTIGCRIIVENPKEYELCKKLKEKKKKGNPNGSVVSLLLQCIEDHILGIMYNKMGRPKNVILCFDGMAVLKSDFPDVNLIDIEDEITAKTSFEMKLVVKEFCYAVDLKDIAPEAEKYPYTEFEKTNFKIFNSAMYGAINSDGAIIFRTEEQLKMAYKHYPKDFIKNWITANPHIRIYDDVEFYPEPLICPPNKFNLWTQFEMEEITEWEHKGDELKMLLDHILILCDNDKEVAKWLTCWIGQMIQYPAVKSRTPVLISKQGSGKGTLMKIICKMIGKRKYWETAKPQKHVWGDFNPMLANCYFVNLNEIGKKQVMEAEEELKSLQTDESLTINDKGKSPFEIRSYHRFFITTNHMAPLNPEGDDRRNVFIRTSDELIGNYEYFSMWNDEILPDVNCIKTFYEYFKSLPDLDKFHKMPVPNTDHQQDLKQLAICKPEQWLKYFTYRLTVGGNAIPKEPTKLSSMEIFQDFNNWKENQKVQYDTNPLKLVIAIKNLRIDGINTKKEKMGNSTLFDLVKLASYFKLDTDDDNI
jgi:hypothetical protein